MTEILRRMPKNTKVLPKTREKEEAQSTSASKCLKVHALFQIIFYDLHYRRKRTPLHTMNNQIINETCKSATFIKSFNQFESFSSYDEVLYVQNYMANFVADASKDAVEQLHIPVRTASYETGYIGFANAPMPFVKVKDLVLYLTDILSKETLKMDGSYLEEINKGSISSFMLSA